MKRYLRYHAGVSGYGFERKATSMPLATGTSVHACLAEILYKEQAGRPATRDEIRGIIKTELDSYRDKLKNGGWLITGTPPDAAQEQFCLVEGMVWAWVRSMLPIIRDEFEIVAVEHEEELKLGKVTQMLRPDILLRRKSDGKIGNHDFKTASYVNDRWIAEYQQSVQMSIGAKGAEARLKEPVDHYYLHALVKGVRKSEYNPGTGDYDGPVRQHSLLCYLYYKEANPPFSKEDFQPKWKYKGADGKSHSLGRAYSKKPVWEADFPKKPADQSNVEFWVFSLPQDIINELFVLVGPYETNKHLVKQYSQSMPAEEERWHKKLDHLKNIEKFYGWASDEFQEALDFAIPRSYKCHSYGAKCSFYEICFRTSKTWMDPIGSGRFQQRVPHHAMEMKKMLSEGVLLPSAPAEQEEVGEEV